jgi:hypothetical protein
MSQAPKQSITLDTWLTSSGQFPKRAESSELTPEIRKNAEQLCRDVSNCLRELGIMMVRVSSGFRPSAANAAAGGAKRSGHLRGLAIDLSDPEGHLDELLSKNPQILKKHGLYIENPKVTIGWCHLDQLPRADRPSRMFTP